MDKWTRCYDLTKHPSLLIEVFSHGQGTASFCKEAGISRQTFYRWLDDNPEFSAAYGVAKECKEAYFEARLLDGIDSKEVNTTILLHTSKTMGSVGAKMLSLRGFDKNGTFQDHFNCLLTNMAEQNIDADGAKTFAEILKVGVQIEENTLIKQEVREIKEHLGMESGTTR